VEFNSASKLVAYFVALLGVRLVSPGLVTLIEILQEIKKMRYQEFANELTLVKNIL
jgi:hypothetical protein